MGEGGEAEESSRAVRSRSMLFMGEGGLAGQVCCEEA